MNLDLFIKTLLILLLLSIIIYTIKISRAIKINNRINKYTIKNKNRQTSIGDFIFNIYLDFKQIIINILSKSTYFKNKSKYYERFAHKNKIDGLNVIATKFCISFFSGIIYTVYSLFYNKFDFMLLLFTMVLFYTSYNIYLNTIENIRNRQIENELLRAVVIMNNAFKSGYNITQAVDMVVKDLTGPISEEFAKISFDLKYGLDIKDVFDRFYDRVKLEDVKYITSSLSLLNITGGNLVGVFTNIEKSFTNNKRLRDELNSMTASSKLVYYIMLVMPILLSLILLLISPNYFEPLFTHMIGYLIIIFILILYFSYIIIIKKILRVDYE